MTKHTSVWKRASMMAALLAGLAVLLPAALVAQEEEEKGTPVLFSDFEDGKLGDWHGRGHDENIEKVEVTKESAHSGKNSLKIFNRTTTWQGPQHLLVVDPKPGSIYRVKAWLYYNEGPDTATFNLSIEKSFQDEKAAHSYANIKFLPVSKGKWTEFVSEFIVPADNTIKSLDVYFEIPWKSGEVSADDKISFFIDDVKIDQLDPANRPKIEEDIPSLNETLGKWFSVGIAAVPEEVAPSNQTSRLILKHFGVITPGNTMKWDSIEPKEGQFNWGPADAIVDFAGLGGMAVHGHTLVWHAQTPAWVFQDPADPKKLVSKEVLTQRMKTHISEVVGNYEGLVGSWDVVNEVISDSTGELRSAKEGSKWMEVFGSQEFIEIALRTAHEADPEAKLAINEYGIESSVKKRDALYKLVKDLKKKGVPLDIVGMQMHINMYTPSVKEIRDCIQKFSDLGVKVQITEIDMSIYSGATEMPKKPDAKMLLAQAKRYKEIFDVFKDFAKKGLIKVVTLWGGSDDGSWLNDFPVKGRGDFPLLFDRKLKAKPAFWAIVDPSKVKGL